MRLQGHPQFCFPDSLLIFLIPIPIPSRPQCRTKKQWRSLVIQQIQELDEQIHCSWTPAGSITSVSNHIEAKLPHYLS